MQMKSFDYARWTLCVGASVASLPGCGQSSPPLGAAQSYVHAGRATSGWSFSIVYKFRNARGARPNGELLDVGGTLYGTTAQGGAYNRGTVFSISRRGADAVVYSFGASSGDGAQPRAALIDLNGTLYGTTEYGGTNAYGTVFSVTPSGSEKVLYRFAGGTDGANPVGPVIAVNGTLYGATYFGGAVCGYSKGCGTVYSVTPDGTETVLHAFGASRDGAFPGAGLLDVNGTLYGTTESGGSGCKGFYAPACGVVYTLSASGSENVIYRFKGGSDGAQPAAPLIDVNGTLYGTTAFGGGDGCDLESQQLGCGVVYSLTPSGSEKVLHRFCVGTEHDAANPAAPLLNVNGTLYGTASSNGTCPNDLQGPGTVYSVTTAGVVNILHTFTPEDGQAPSSGLIDVSGALEGVTRAGGRSCRHDYNYSGCGVVYALSQ
jgi:uncharacterized repeat protein (TIGR03803 family)